MFSNDRHSYDIVIVSPNGISHHHGVELARPPYIEEELGSSFKALQRIKQAFDPAGILNPGKLRLSEQT